MSELPAWVEGYRGKPFLRDADGPDAYDCYGLIRAVLRDVWGAATPALDGAWHLDTAAQLRAATGTPDSPWRVTNDPPSVGDVLAFLPPRSAGELHVGIVVAPGVMLHARQEGGSQTARYDRPPWAVLRIGPVWRHEALRGPVTDLHVGDVLESERVPVPLAMAEARGDEREPHQGLAGPLRAHLRPLDVSVVPAASGGSAVGARVRDGGPAVHPAAFSDFDAPRGDRHVESPLCVDRRFVELDPPGRFALLVPEAPAIRREV